jgi:hypothetical protein
VLEIVDAGSGTVEVVVLRVDHARHQAGVLRLAAGGAPSSQSQVTSNTGPSSSCRANDFSISFSEPA